MTRQENTRQEKQCEIKDEEKSKEIITHTYVQKNGQMIYEINNENESKKTKQNERYKAMMNNNHDI